MTLWNGLPMAPDCITARPQARGAKIYADSIGFGTNSNGRHVTQAKKGRHAKFASK